MKTNHEDAKKMNETLEAIARQELQLETLTTRSSDSLDFHERAVWTLRAALVAAYRAGAAAAAPSASDTSSRPFRAQRKTA